MTSHSYSYLDQIISDLRNMSVFLNALQLKCGDHTQERCIGIANSVSGHCQVTKSSNTAIFLCLIKKNRFSTKFKIDMLFPD